MKIQNRKRLNIIIAAFVAVFVAGGAFAFVAAGPLLFSGTANVDAELAIRIVNSETRPYNDPSNMFTNYTLLTENEYNIDPVSNDGHSVTFSANFSRPYQIVHFVHTIENEGTMDAQITAINFGMKNIDGVTAENHEDFQALKAAVEQSVMAHFGSSPGGWGTQANLANITLNNVMTPGQKEDIWFRIFLNPIPAEFEMSSLNAEIEFELEIIYGLAQ